MAKIKTRPYDVVEYLKTDEDIAAYFEAALEDGDPDILVHALSNISRARGIARIARKAGIKREVLVKELSANGKPAFTTVLKIARALGLRLNAQPVRG